MRLFIGVEIPKAQREVIAATFLPEYGLDFVRCDRLHFTLRFIGNRASPVPLLSKLDTISVHPPFNLMVEGVGVFPSQPPHRPITVLWADLAYNTSLISLKNTIDVVLGPDGNMNKYGGYSPHLTLAKVPPARQLSVERYLDRNKDLLTEVWTVNSFCLFNNPGDGSPFEKIGEFTL